MKRIFTSLLFWLALVILFFIAFGVFESSPSRDVFLVLAFVSLAGAFLSLVYRFTKRYVKPKAKINVEPSDLPPYRYPSNSIESFANKKEREEYMAKYMKLLQSPKRTFTDYVAGTKYSNPDGTSRQEIINQLIPGDPVCLTYYLYEGKPAFYVETEKGIIGNVPATLVDEICIRIENGTFFMAEIESIREHNGILYVDLEYTISIDAE